MSGRIQRSQSYLGAVNPTPFPNHSRPRRPASFLFPNNRLANLSHLHRPTYCAPVSAGCGTRIGEHAPSFSADPQAKPIGMGQYYQQTIPTHTNPACSQSNCLTNTGADHLLRQSNPSSVQAPPNSNDYWRIPIFDLERKGSQNYLGSLNRHPQNISSAALHSYPLDASNPKENSSILKDSTHTDSLATVERAMSKASKHGNHVRFTLPEEEATDTQTADMAVVTLDCEPSVSGKRVYLCSEV